MKWFSRRQCLLLGGAVLIGGSFGNWHALLFFLGLGLLVLAIGGTTDRDY